MALSKLAHIAVMGKQHNQQTVNNIYLGIDDAGSPDVRTTLLGLIDDVRTVFRSSGYDCISADWSLDKFVAKIIFPAVSDAAEVSAEAIDVGTLGEALPSFNCQLLRIRTGGGGKGQKGKLFLPGVPEAAQANSVLSGAHVTLLTTFSTELLAAFNPVDIVVGSPAIGVIVRQVNSAPVPLALSSFKRAISISPWNVVATQVRRRVGRGS